MTDADYDPLALPARYFEGLPTGVPHGLPGQPEPVRLGREIEPGTSVRFLPSEIDEQRASFGNNRNPAGVLAPAREYSVERVEIHSWHTKLWLAEVGGPFNSVHFISTPAGGTRQ